MIAQVLNRDFVLERLEEVREDLRELSGGGRRTAGDGPEIGPEEAQEALDLADEAAAQEATVSSGQPGFEPPAAERRRGDEEASPIDDVSFFSRDAVISNLQSALEEYLMREGRAEAAEPADRRRGDEDEEVAVTDLSLPDWPTGPADRRLGEKFSTSDVRWVSSLFAMGVRKWRKRHPFPEKPAEPLEIGDKARLILVGDWGSGVPRARKVAGEMRKVLDEGLEKGREQHVVHLGDVYYSGWEYEYRDRFLKYWPVRPGEEDRVFSWNCNGNHDMYSGGHEYFNYALGDSRFRRQQKSSRFSLLNRHWTILGLDTAWEDHGLAGDQADWAKKMLEGRPGQGLFLSHHQIFSAYEDKPNKLAEKIRPVLDTKRVKSWFWGHEHRCVLYKPHQNVQFARCVGHSGVPVYLADNPRPEIVDYEYRDFFQKGLPFERWTWFGLVVLDFDGPQITVRYIDENGKEHKRESIA